MVSAAYFDSSALVPLYVSQAFSLRADRAVARSGRVPFTVLHQLEVRNALRRLCGRKMITATERDGALAHVEEDLAGRRLVPTVLDLSRTFERALALSKGHGERFLCRALDTLHVAAALELGASRFVSADGRQIALARAVDLDTVDIGHRRRPRTRIRAAAMHLS